MNAPKGTVYIVEDNDSFRKSTVRLVRAFGYRALAFEFAADFLSLDTFESPGCILLDVRLPDIDGLEVQTLLIQKGCRLPIIFMSGHGGIPMSVEVMKKGAVDFLPKPFDPEDLQNAIIHAMVRSAYEIEDEQYKEEMNARNEILTPQKKK